MNFFKKAAVIALTVIGAVGITAGLSACFGKNNGGTNDGGNGLPAEYTDEKGYKRPNNTWLTDSLVLPLDVYEDNYDNLFGDGGESGLINKELLSHESDSFWQDEEWPVGVFVYYIYGNAYRNSFKDIISSFKVSYVEGFSVDYNPDFIGFNNTCQGDFVYVKFDNGNKYSYGSEYAERRFEVSLSDDVKYTELKGGQIAVQTALCFTFEIFGSEYQGDLYFDVGVNAPHIAGSSSNSTERVSLAKKRDGMASAKIENLTAKYVSEDDCPDGDVNGITLKDKPDMSDGKVNYMVIDFTLTALNDNDGSGTLNTLIRVPESELLNARLISAPTGNIHETFVDNETFFDATFGVPDIKGVSKNVRIIIRLTPQSNSIVNIELYLSGDGSVLSGSTYSVFRVQAGTQILKLELNSDGQSYKVVGIWDNAVSQIDIPDTFNELPVTSVETSFSSLKLLKKITVGNNVKYLSNDFVKSSTTLQSITIGEGITNLPDGVFSGCTALSDITLPNGVTELKSDTFSGCTALASVTGGVGINKVGSSCFKDCSSLTSAPFVDRLSQINGSAYEGCAKITSVSINSEVKSIGSNAFSGCIKLATVTGGEGVTSVASGAFNGCTALKTIPFASVQNIGVNAFKDCTSLTQITIPDCCSAVGAGAFSGTPSVTKITIGAAFNPAWTIVRDMFDVTNLESIVVSSDNANYRGDGNCLIYGRVIYLGCKNSVIPTEGVIRISDRAFAGNKKITSITIPENITESGEDVFMGCTALKTAKVSTGSNFKMFRNCTALTSVELLSGCTSINHQMFNGCTALTSVKIDASVTVIISMAFNNCSKLTQLTYTGTRAQWQAIDKKDGWNSGSSLTSVRCSDGVVNLSSK